MGENKGQLETETNDLVGRIGLQPDTGGFFPKGFDVDLNHSANLVS